MSSTIPFDHIRDVSLAQAPRLLAEWFPNGRVVGREFKVGNIAGDPGISLCINLNTGVGADFAGDDEFADLIDVRAAMNYKRDRVAAARELMTMLGIMNGHDTHSETPRQEHTTNTKDDVWEPTVPPPTGAAKPDKREFVGFDHTYDYMSANGHTLFYIRRREARNGKRKQFFPLTYGNLNGKIGWHAKHPDRPRPLYGLNLLASMPRATVIVCEGEKSAIAAQHLFPDYVCVTWPCGAKSVGDADLSPLRNRRIIIWPDNDAEGHKAGEFLKATFPNAGLLRVDDLLPGHDAADINPDDPAAWLAERVEMPPETIDGNWWVTRDLTRPKPVLGEVICTSTRMMIGGPTGSGKTHLAMAMAGACCTKRGFLHWLGPSEPLDILYIDGEMARDLVQDRMCDLHRRLGKPDFSRFHMLCREDFPAMQGLNTPAGQEFVLAWVERIKPAIVFLDSRMCLLVGDMKDEIPWTETMPLVLELTRRQVAQVWLDHTGHDSGHIYGSKTKEWMLDVVVLVEALGEPDTDISIKIKFTKARRKRPETRADFAPVAITLRDDEWSCAPVEPEIKPAAKGREMSDGTELMHRAILNLASGKDTGFTIIKNDMPEARAVRRTLLRSQLVSGGWFVEGVDYSEDTEKRTVRLTQKGLDREGTALKTLRRRGKCDFDRSDVWLT